MTVHTQKIPGNHAESVREVICLLTAADRQTGHKTIASLQMQAEALMMPKRRPRTIFERDRMPVVGFAEYIRVLLLGASYLRRIALKLRQQADRWDAEADVMELNHRQLTLWHGEAGWESGGDGRPQRLAA